MALKNLYKILAVVIFTFLLSSCSNPKKDYEPVQQLQKTTEQSIASTRDDAANIKSCQNVIDALKNFIKDHPEGEWNLTATTSLTGWQAKADSIQEIVNSQMDFEKIQKLQAAAEDVMQHSSDYAVEIKNCDDMTEQLQQYISKHPKSDWSASAQTALMSWKSRKAHIEQQLNSLIMKVANLMEQRVRQEAKKVHPMSNIEKLQIESSNTSAIGGNIKVTSIVAVRMRGAIFGKDIFKLEITVSGEIVPESKQVFVDDDVKVVE